jgi:predicted nucleic acid-binding protein
VQLVIADTGPINYLVLIDHVGILPALFGKVILPAAVHAELGNVDTPEAVRQWIANAPEWIEIRHSASPTVFSELGAGESESITLALELHADLLLMDDRRGVKVARERRIEVTGTLGVLARAGQLGIIDLRAAFERLKQTSFRYHQEIMDQFLGDPQG